FLRNPPDARPPILVDEVLGASAEPDVVGVTFGARHLPRVAETQPLVGRLHLPAVADRLVEDAEFVADAVTHRRVTERREQIHVAGREPAEAAVAKAGLFFLFHYVGE